MLHGIELSLQKRITNPVVISDSKVLVDMVNQEIRDNHNLLTLVCRIRRMTQRIGTSNSIIFGGKEIDVHIGYPTIVLL